MISNSQLEKVVPFFFKNSDSQLFGVYHPLAGTTQRNHAVVLCYPLGDEYIRSHRAFYQLATRLNRIGFPVLRFDYFGTGDSSGEDADATMTRWAEDTSGAVEELKKLAGVEKVILIGLRLGGTLVVSVASKRQDVAGLVLWEPIVDGKAYIDELSEAHEHKLFYIASHSAPQETNQAPAIDYLGFRFSPQMLDDISNVAMLNSIAIPHVPTLVVESSGSPEMQALTQHLTDAGIQATHQQVESPVIWAEDPDKALVPHQLLQAIITWVGQQFA